MIRVCLVLLLILAVVTIVGCSSSIEPALPPSSTDNSSQIIDSDLMRNKQQGMQPPPYVQPPPTPPTVSEPMPTPGGGIPVGSITPDFTLTELSGQEVCLSSLIGQPVILYFWATWLDTCKADMMYLQQIYNERDAIAPGLIILAINVGEPAGLVSQLIVSSEPTFPILLDTESVVSAFYNARDIPITYFIDESGIVYFIHTGPFDNSLQIWSDLMRNKQQGMQPPPT